MTVLSRFTGNSTQQIESIIFVAQILTTEDQSLTNWSY